MAKLPTIMYKKKICVVDFKLGEMRCGKSRKSVKFTSLPKGPHSKIKEKLRGLRTRHWHNDYVRGIDD